MGFGMTNDSELEQHLEADREVKRGTIRSARHSLRRAAGIALVVIAGLFFATVLFRMTNPISPIGVAAKFGAPSIKHTWLPLERMSPDLPLAVIASEDGRFCNHWGVDWSAVREVFKDGGGIGAGLRGASTIPMQLAKNLYLWPERSYVRKSLEVPLAYLISALWRKEVVMETYLNIAPWGPVVGAEKASRYYFQKSAADLSRREAILLAVTLPNPSFRNPANPSPRVSKIAQAVDKRMPILASRSKCVLLQAANPGVKPDDLEGPANWP
jgi:monofunctional biosynthetic peptidoglycan transglycosylase